MIELAVVAADITQRPCDLLVLKHADGFYGVDAIVSERLGFTFNMMEISFFLGREKLVASKRPHFFSTWSERLFIWMQRNAVSATEFFRIPSNRVVELGAQVEV